MLKRKSSVLLMGCLVIVFGSVFLQGAQEKFRDSFTVDKASLSDSGSGTYMILKPGFKLTLADGKDTLTITVLDETKMVDGVKTRIIEERETGKGKLVEVSRNYFAVDKATGDIYYFGEDVDMYDKAGKVTNHEGSWLSGVDGARFGLAMPGKPEVSDKYYQEQAPGTALDRAENVSVTQKVDVPAGKFMNCLKTKESSDLEKGTESKVYAAGIGLLKDEGFELKEIEFLEGEKSLPDAVEKTFKEKFPDGQIEKLEAEAENGVTVYDFEFKDGTTEKETDITSDGTMLEFTIVVDVNKVPAAAMDTINKEAKDGTIKRIEQVELGYEMKDGQVIKLPEMVTKYEVEITKDGKTDEIVVDKDGKLLKD